ncbi:hypothetical protein BOTBODRAFT_476623 [Botryobasidium botryosum FD-172 SS1]|uniref:Uncharacterized protein n=1 Tax=Botryobasidium botryosum (strain FD-172 SS1) TaxID=930990 RepID=A0A067N3Y5_BOTB1|nr:hypothetical protein BOTBODRAFT_476623 [Botryobasidium botryosum FD-172 SS1]
MAVHKPGTVVSPEMYLPALLSSLTSELSREKELHRKARSHAEAKIEALKGQIARRDAELETCILAAGCPEQKPAETTQPRVTRGEALAVLDKALQKNKSLEKETEELGRKLGGTRVLPSPPPPPSPSPSSPSFIPEYSQPGDPSPGSQIAHNDLGSDVAPTLFPKYPSPSISAQTVLTGLDQHIYTLGGEIKELLVERDHLRRTSSEIPVSPPYDQAALHEFEGILLIEEECIRLRASEAAGKLKLDKLRRASEEREAELLEVISQMEQRLLQGLRNSYPITSETASQSSYAEPHGISHDSGEISSSASEGSTARQENFSRVWGLEDPGG